MEKMDMKSNLCASNNPNWLGLDPCKSIKNLFNFMTSPEKSTINNNCNNRPTFMRLDSEGNSSVSSSSEMSNVTSPQYENYYTEAKSPAQGYTCIVSNLKRALSPWMGTMPIDQLVPPMHSIEKPSWINEHQMQQRQKNASVVGGPMGLDAGRTYASVCASAAAAIPKPIVNYRNLITGAPPTEEKPRPQQHSNRQNMCNGNSTAVNNNNCQNDQKTSLHPKHRHWNHRIGHHPHQQQQQQPIRSSRWFNCQNFNNNYNKNGCNSYYGGGNPNKRFLNNRRDNYYNHYNHSNYNGNCSNDGGWGGRGWSPHRGYQQHCFRRKKPTAVNGGFEMGRGRTDGGKSTKSAEELSGDPKITGAPSRASSPSTSRGRGRRCRKRRKDKREKFSIDEEMEAEVAAGSPSERHLNSATINPVIHCSKIQNEDSICDKNNTRNGIDFASASLPANGDAFDGICFKRLRDEVPRRRSSSSDVPPCEGSDNKSGKKCSDTKKRCCISETVAYILGFGSSSDSEEEEDQEDDWGVNDDDEIDGIMGNDYSKLWDSFKMDDRWSINFVQSLSPVATVEVIVGVGVGEDEDEDLNVDVHVEEGEEEAVEDDVPSLYFQIGRTVEELEDVNRRWEAAMTGDCGVERKNRASESKIVHFPADCKLREMFCVEWWDRKGLWEEYARDRARFRKRIEKVEGQIGHVFTWEHRMKIYNSLKQTS